MSFALSSLLFVSEEQLEVLDDEELALFTSWLMRFNNNRKNRRRGNNTCFEYGKPGHFIADCPDKNKLKSGYDYSKDKDKDKKKKYYDREKKEKRKKAKAHAFITSLSDVDSDTDDHDDPSSSEEDDDRKAKKDAKNINGLCFYTNENCGGYYVMALDADEHKDNDSELEAEDGGLENMWLIDYGCSRHMTRDSRWFSSLTPVMTKEYITFGDNSHGDD
ncbi:uncharacterized protein LOC112887092 isoform X3 [Panicum hallii]|uniref:uncharacterized protein LOC112887092 isoform X3 n=1 Tax=Panicum hallii TaxID=206008 RepID=UPI000DF4EF7D|nr:uncharacterized protein LOC112887092 isoform X3 [Panicum hallii]